MADQEIVLRINLDSETLRKDTRKALRELERAAQKSGDKVEGRLSGAFRVVGNQLSDIKNRFAGLFTGFAIIQATRSLAQFEQQLVAVAKTTGFTETQIAKFSDQILDLSRRIPVATDELLRISEIAGQLGINDSANLTKFTETVARLSNSVSGVSADELAIQLARITELTGENIEDVDRLGSALVQLGNNFAVNEGQIARTSLEVAKIAGIYDLSSAQVLGLSTALAQSGVQAEVARTTFLKLTDAFGLAVSRGGAPLNQFASQIGISTQEFRRLVKEDPTETILQFVKSLDRAKDAGEDINDTLRALGLSEIRVRSGITALVNTVDSLEDALGQSEKAFDENTALIEESEQAFNTFGKQLKQTINIITAFGKSFTADLLNPLTSLLKNLNEILRGNRFPELAEQIKSTTKSIITFGTAFFAAKGIAAAFTFLIAKGPIAVTALIAFRKNLRLLLAVFSKSNLAFAALAFSIERLVSALNQPRRVVLTKTLDDLREKLADAKKEAKEARESIGKQIGVTGGFLPRPIFGTAEQAEKAAENVQFIEAQIKGVEKSLADLDAKGEQVNPLSTLPEKTNASLEQTNEVLASQTEAFTGFSDFVGSIFENLFKNINTSVKLTKEQVEELNKSLTNVLAKSISRAVDGVVTAIVRGENAFEAFANGVGLLIADLATTLGNFFIAAGVAQTQLVSLNPAGTIAAGVALVALGSLLRGVFSGESDGTSVPTAEEITEDSIDEIDEDDLAGRQGQITINVDGTVLDPRSVGLQIADVLKEVNDSNDLVTVNV